MITNFSVFEKSYSSTSERSKEITNTEAISYLEELAALYGYNDIKDLPYLYRGRYSKIDYDIYDPTKTERKSANTSNHYTLLMDNLDVWEDYPKRSKSLICSTTADTAAGYGDTFLVFTKPDVKVGVCYSSDLWNSFKKLTAIGYDMDDFNKVLKANGIRDTSYNDLINDLKKSDGITVQDSKNKKINLKSLDDIIYLINPSSNDFKLIDFKDVKNIKDDKECWFSSEALLIKINSEIGKLFENDNKA